MIRDILLHLYIEPVAMRFVYFSVHMLLEIDKARIDTYVRFDRSIEIDG